eukprot:COSAG02_NODE_39053_length_421_cov_1.419255_2_plen_21_part_01
MDICACRGKSTAIADIIREEV